MKTKMKVVLYFTYIISAVLFDLAKLCLIDKMRKFAQNLRLGSNGVRESIKGDYAIAGTARAVR